MALLTGADVLTELGISTKAKIDPSRFDGYIAAALVKLESWVSKDAWTDANKESPSDVARAQIFKSAAAYLTMYFGLPSLHTYLTENGVILSAQAEGSTVLRYLTPKEVETKQLNYWNTAREMIEQYLVTATDNPQDKYFDMGPTTLQWFG